MARVEEILDGEGGRGEGEKVSPFFAFIFPLFPQKRLILRLNFPIRRLCISQFHLRPAPPGYCGAFARLVSPGGGAFANFALPGGRAFANPRAIPELLTRTRFPIRI